jgi:ketosteroid isomerase-like protein
MGRVNRFLFSIVLAVMSSVAYAAPGDLETTFNSSKGFVTSESRHDDFRRAVAQAKPTGLVATEDEVRQFFVNYVDRHAQKDVDGLLALFSDGAVQNQRDGFDEIKRMYSDLFNQSQEVRYHIEDIRIDVFQNAVVVRGHCEVDQVLKRGRQRRVWEGEVRWILVRENGVLKIRYLDDWVEGSFHRASFAHFVGRPVYEPERSFFGHEGGRDLLAGDGNRDSDGSGSGSEGSGDGDSGGGGGGGDGDGGNGDDGNDDGNGDGGGDGGGNGGDSNE